MGLQTLPLCLTSLQAVGAGSHRVLTQLAQGLLDGLKVFAVVAIHGGHPLGGAPLLAERIGLELTQDLDLLVVLKIVVLKDRHNLPFDMRQGKSSRMTMSRNCRELVKRPGQPAGSYL